MPFILSFKFYLFICLWLFLVFLAVHRLSLVVASRGYSLVAACGLLIVMASLCCTARTLGVRISVVVVCGLSSCGSPA